MYIGGPPAIHMVDEATHFCKASNPRRQSAKEIWKTIQQMRCFVHLGSHEYLAVERGSSYKSKKTRESAKALDVHLDEALIEKPGAIGTVKRYQVPLKLVYERILADKNCQTSDQECLPLAVVAANCMVEPEGLCPALLVFGPIPIPARKLPAPSKLERSRLIDRVMEEIVKD